MGLAIQLQNYKGEEVGIVLHDELAILIENQHNNIDSLQYFQYDENPEYDLVTKFLEYEMNGDESVGLHNIRIFKEIYIED